MSVELIVISYPSNADDQQFLASVKVRGQYFDAGSESPNGALITGAPMNHPLHQALKGVGIEPYSLHTEDELRSALEAIGLNKEEIEAKFASARSQKTTITFHQ
jgi:hypothetical protein